MRVRLSTDGSVPFQKRSPETVAAVAPTRPPKVPSEVVMEVTVDVVLRRGGVPAVGAGL